ncbi:DivIVA domain-containing protein [Aerococcaceae bacterium DSM 111020]|nr:DivIVA domain-containing protein [Aerococcaceae bacterium DSM 111020]
MDKSEQLSLSLFGYNRNQVDTLIEQQNQKMTDLEKQIQSITEQLENTQQALAHYEEIEQALTEGIVDARVKGQEIVELSEDQAKQLLDATNEQVTQYKEEFVFHSRELMTNGSQLREELNEMKSKMQLIIDSYQELLDGTDFDSLYPEKQVDRLMHQVEAYESDDVHQTNRQAPPTEPQLSDDEKEELTKLINDVISNEEGAGKDTSTKSPKKDNLVDFTTIIRP